MNWRTSAYCCRGWHLTDAMDDHLESCAICATAAGERLTVRGVLVAAVALVAFLAGVLVGRVG